MRRVLWLLVLVLVGCPKAPPPPPPTLPQKPPASTPAAVPSAVVPAPPQGPRPPADLAAIVSGLPPFAFRDEDCQVLVWYALDGRAGVPRTGSPALVLHTVPPRELSRFNARPAPHLTVHTIRETLDLVGKISRHISKSMRDELVRLKAWIDQIRAPYFCVQLEPSEIAGDGTAALRAWAKREQ